MVDLLGQRHREGHRFRPAELMEEGPRVAVRFESGVYKVVTFGDDGAVLLQDCAGREDALRVLSGER